MSDDLNASESFSLVGAEADDTGSAAPVAQTAKDQGRQVAVDAKQASQHVAGVASEQAQNVVAEAQHQARSLFSEGRSQLNDQATTQLGNLSGWLHSLADELHTMVDRSSSSGTDQEAGSGPATDVVRQASTRVGDLADWLERHEPADVLDEAARLARRRPGLFLAGAAVAGLVAGRLTRGLTAGGRDNGSHSTVRDLDSSTAPSLTTPGATTGTPVSTPIPAMTTIDDGDSSFDGTDVSSAPVETINDIDDGDRDHEIDVETDR